MHSCIVAEQSLHRDALYREACAIRGITYSNGSCDITLETPQIKVPILPCNFLPVQSRSYSGKET